MSNIPEPVRLGDPFYRLRVGRALSLAALLVVMAVTCTVRSGVALAQYTPSLQTDRTAYAAGDEIAISGHGFAPHEQVTLSTAREDGSADPQLGSPWTSVADDAGAVTTTSIMTADDNVGRRFVIRAVGAASGASHSPVFVRSPLVATDSGVYVAGDTVRITGRDFRAGETVTLKVVHVDGTAEPGMGHEPVDATVRYDGTLAATWIPTNEDLAGTQLKVVVVGAVSGEIPAADFLRVADLSTDKADYYPGETVRISGRGFAPNELVRLQVVHANGRAEGGLGHDPFYATADASGNVLATWFVNPDAYGLQFHVIAKGESSKVSGITTFWDAGPVSLTALDTAYTQNFDTLATTGTTNPWTDGGPPLDGWYSQFSLQPTNPTVYRADGGGSNAGAIYSWGVSATNPLTERAFGSLASGTPGTILNAVRFVNNTGSTITSLDVSYTGEQWRAGGCNANPCPAGLPTTQKLDFQYQVGAAGVITDANAPPSGWFDYDALDFTSPNPGTVGDRTARVLDGNAAGNRTALSSTITVSVSPGQEIWLRWQDVNDQENDHGLAVDDLSVTPHGAVATPTLTINDVSQSEGDAGTTIFSFTVSLSAPAGPGGVTFDIATADGTAQDDNPASDDNDYVARSLTSQTILEGSQSYTFDVTVNGDAAPESDETFFVNIANVTGATVTDGQGLGTIDNDDADEVAPTVTSTLPADGATDVPLNQNVVVNFSEPVSVTDPWFSMTCTMSGSHAAAVTGGPTSFTLNPSADFAFGESCTLVIDAAKVSDQDGNDPPDTMVVNFTAGFATAPDPCAQSFTPIYQIQGSGLSAAITGTVTTQGVVVGDFEGSASQQGFFLQDPAGDGNSATSDGIFVFTGNSNLVSIGQNVRVTGFARERFNQTTINGSNNNAAEVPAANIVSCGTGSVTAIDVTMPFASTTDPERFEGMLVRFPQPLVIAEYFNYDRFGEMVLALPLAGETRPFTGTAIDAPGAAANARTLANSLRRITLDDANSAQNPAVLRHPNGNPFSLTNRFRGGDTVQNAVGVLGFDFSLYRIFPTAAADYTSLNPRPISPEPVGGMVRVAAMNTLNFFVTLDTTTSDSGPGPCGGNANLDCRGADADQPDEFTRQRDKLLSALTGLDADVIGLNELENTPGAEPLQSITAGMPGYDYINTGTIGTDAIKVGLIYRAAVVTPVGVFKTLTSAVDPRFIDTLNRPTLAQTFEVNATGERFTLAVNHLKSKGSACSGDPDLGDGQGNCSQTRRAAAEALVDWLATDPTGSGDPDFLIVGDLNSYAQEDALVEIKAGSDDAAGTGDDYTNLISHFHGAYAYSYTFDGQAGYLDHALATAGMLAQVTGATEWHINSDEPDILDYDTTFKPAEQEALYEPNAYRTSDHDAVVIGLFPVADLSVTKVDSADPVTVSDTFHYTLTVVNNGPRDATGVTVTDTLPADVAFVSATPGCVNNSGTVSCAVGVLPIGASVNLTITVTAPSTPGLISNSVSVAGHEFDSNTANNSAIETTQVNPAPAADLSITKSDSADPMTVGHSLTYTLKVTNNGPDAATGVTVTDTLPAGVAFVSASAGCVNGSGTVTCAIGGLANGGTVTLTITVTAPTTPGSISNTAAVAGSPTDPHPANNSATEITEVRAAAISRFVAFSRDMTWLRAGAIAVTGDVGANERRMSGHADAAPDDGGRKDVTVRIGVGAKVQQTLSRTVGDTVLLMPLSTVNNVVDNFLLKKIGATVLGTTTTPMAVPFTTLPAFPSVTPGTQNITVAKNQTLTLGAGRYGAVKVSNGGKLVLTGGLYEIKTLALDQSAAVMFKAPTQLRIKTELGSKAKAKLILDPSVPGLRASQMVIYVAGRDAECSAAESDDDGDNGGPVTVHIGAQNEVQANIYAANGTVWLKSKTQATGAFIGVHVRIGVNARLTLDSAF